MLFNKTPTTYSLMCTGKKSGSGTLKDKKTNTRNIYTWLPRLDVEYKGWTISAGTFPMGSLTLDSIGTCSLSVGNALCGQL